MSNEDPYFGRVRISYNMRKVFILEKFSSHSPTCSNFPFFFMVEKKQKALSPAKERKKDKVVRWPMSCCTSLKYLGHIMLMITCHLSRFASIPLFVSRKPRKFPICTLKEHLSGFKCMLYILIDCMVSFKSVAWICPSKVFIIMSSAQTSKFLPIY